MLCNHFGIQLWNHFGKCYTSLQTFNTNTQKIKCRNTSFLFILDTISICKGKPCCDLYVHVMLSLCVCNCLLSGILVIVSVYYQGPN